MQSSIAGLADAFERDQIEGLTDETTIGQLAGLLYEVKSQGRMKIESKEKARERGAPSPDRAEALMLALGKAPQKMEVYLLRAPPRLRAKVAESSSPGAEHPYWGFSGNSLQLWMTKPSGGGDGREAGRVFDKRCL